MRNHWCKEVIWGQGRPEVQTRRGRPPKADPMVLMLQILQQQMQMQREQQELQQQEAAQERQIHSNSRKCSNESQPKRGNSDSNSKSCSDVVLQKYVCSFLGYREKLQAPVSKMDIRTFPIQGQCSRPVAQLTLYCKSTYVHSWAIARNCKRHSGK